MLLDWDPIHSELWGSVDTLRSTWCSSGLQNPCFLSCALYPTLPLWKWNGGRGPASLLSTACWNSSISTILNNLTLEFVWIKNVHTLQNDPYSGLCYFKSCHYVSSARSWEAFLQRIPLSGHSNVVIWGENAHVIPLNVDGVSSAKRMCNIIK